MILPKFQGSVLPPPSRMEPVQTSETSVTSYQSTRRYNAEGSHLHSHRHENLKSFVNLYNYLRPTVTVEQLVNLTMQRLYTECKREKCTTLP
jgi:hypothetical protein